MHYSLYKEKLKNLRIFYQHPSYSLEKKLLNEIKMGLDDEATSTMSLINSTERASLSRNSLRSLKNSLIISCALFARSVIEANVSPEDVYTLSDIFIGHIEELKDADELRSFEYEMIDEFIRLVNTSETHDYSQPVTTVINYIHDHLTEPLTVGELAHLVSKSPDYLSKVFKKEVGLRLTSYIQMHKIELSKYYLEFTDMKVIDIAVELSFCNQGYFSSTFKKFMGCSPSEYKLQLKS